MCPPAPQFARLFQDPEALVVHLEEPSPSQSRGDPSPPPGEAVGLRVRCCPSEAGRPRRRRLGGLHQQYHGHEIRDILTVQYISIVSVSRRIFPKLGTGLHQQQYHGHEKMDILAASVLLIIPIKSLQSEDLHLLDYQAQT